MKRQVWAALVKKPAFYDPLKAFVSTEAVSSCRPPVSDVSPDVLPLSSSSELCPLSLRWAAGDEEGASSKYLIRCLLMRLIGDRLNPR